MNQISYLLLFTILFLTRTLFAQNYYELNKDSIYFLDISKTLNLEVVERLNDSILALPFVHLDFPNSYFDSNRKIIKTYRDQSLKIPKSTTALIRIEAYATNSYGRGGSGDLVFFNNQSSIIDSNVTVDSVSISGVFYLKINNKPVIIDKTRDYKFEIRQRMKNEYAIYDIISEYNIINYGYIRRKIVKE